MRAVFLIAGVWLATPPAPAQTPLAASEILRFTQEETPGQLLRFLGRPVQIADTDGRQIVWSYQTDTGDAHEASHLLVFDKRDGRLVSVTRNFHLPVTVDALFPEAKSAAHCLPGEAGRKWCVRVRAMGPERLAIALGVEKAGEATTQLIVLRRSELGRSFPWLMAYYPPPG